jgi:ADP-heptose:LPS heptosyltransferase
MTRVSRSPIAAWITWLTHPRAITLRRRSRALGDNLLLSCLAREIKQHAPSRYVIVETCWPELFDQNPHVDAVSTTRVSLWPVTGRYVIGPDTQDHLMDQMMRRLPFPVRAWERQVDLYYREDAVNATRQGIPASYLIVNPAGKQTHAANRKEWGWQSFCELRQRLAGTPFVQIGDAETPLLPETIDRRGRPILESAHLIKHAEVGIFLEGGMMHEANAVRTPSVIIYGGAIRPDVSGYAMHRNLHATPSCSPCFQSEGAMTGCSTMECMRMISVEEVAAAVGDLRRRRVGPGSHPEATA